MAQPLRSLRRSRSIAFVASGIAFATRSGKQHMRRFTPPLLIASLSVAAQTWVQLTDYPGTPRDDAASFTINDKVYVGTGLDEDFQLMNDWYAYQLGIDEWDTIAALPASPRQYCASFTVNDQGYLFGGLDVNGPLNELWRYDPLSDTWDQRASLPAPGRYAAAAMMNEVHAFISTGMLAGGIPTNETWRYDPSADAWIMVAPAPGPARHRAAAMGLVLIGGADTAFNALADVHYYEPATDTWSAGPTMPGARFSADAADGVLIGGAMNTTAVSDSCWALALQWDGTSTPPFPPGGRRSGVIGLNLAFADIGFILFGTGSDNVQRYDDWWMLTFPVGMEQRSTDMISVRPNPATDHINLSSAAPLAGLRCELVDDLGRTVISTSVPLDGRIALLSLTPGRYTLLVRGRDAILRSSFITLP